MSCFLYSDSGRFSLRDKRCKWTLSNSKLLSGSLDPWGQTLKNVFDHLSQLWKITETRAKKSKEKKPSSKTFTAHDIYLKYERIIDLICFLSDCNFKPLQLPQVFPQRFSSCFTYNKKLPLGDGWSGSKVVNLLTPNRSWFQTKKKNIKWFFLSAHRVTNILGVSIRLED